jgi:hypothetical protein
MQLTELPMIERKGSLMDKLVTTIRRRMEVRNRTCPNATAANSRGNRISRDGQAGAFGSGISHDAIQH